LRHLFKNKSRHTKPGPLLANFLQGFSILRIFGAEESFLTKYLESQKENSKQRYEQLQANLSWTEANNLLLGTTVISAVSYVFFVLHVGVKEVFLLVGSIKQLHEPLKDYGAQRSNIEDTATLIRKLDKPLAARAPIQSKPKRGPNPRQIEFDSVSFGYADGWHMKPVSFEIQAGEKIALVGPNGAGKSTLLKLLAGLYEPKDGHIYLNGIESFNEVGYVVQKPFLFSATIRENIAFYRKLTREQIELAAWQSCAAEFISTLPGQYDSLIRNDGAEFSGGQRQKIHLARSFARQTPILLLDEATASLDLESERRILENCRQNNWQTQIVVSHRAEIRDWADRVIELERMDA
jgi:ATP-binding cassette subfamily B protein